jgi:hypothetical protein
VVLHPQGRDSENAADGARALRLNPVSNINPGTTMAKTQNSKKQTKKAPLKTAKEKKQAKAAKKGR